MTGLHRIHAEPKYRDDENGQYVRYEDAKRLLDTVEYLDAKITAALQAHPNAAPILLQEALDRTHLDGEKSLAQATVEEIMKELKRAVKKFPTWPTDPLHAMAVLGEEYGELNKDILQLTYEPGKSNKDKVRTEAIQTAAMALRFAMSLDEYEYKPCPQHTQR